MIVLGIIFACLDKCGGVQTTDDEQQSNKYITGDLNTMVTAVLRKSGGSVIVTIPQVLLAMLGLTVGEEMEIEMTGQSLVLKRMRPVKRAAKAARQNKRTSQKGAQ